MVPRAVTIALALRGPQHDLPRDCGGISVALIAAGYATGNRIGNAERVNPSEPRAGRGAARARETSAPGWLSSR